MNDPLAIIMTSLLFLKLRHYSILKKSTFVIVNNCLLKMRKVTIMKGQSLVFSLLSKQIRVSTFWEFYIAQKENNLPWNAFQNWNILDYKKKTSKRKQIAFFLFFCPDLKFCCLKIFWLSGLFLFTNLRHCQKLSIQFEIINKL